MKKIIHFLLMTGALFCLYPCDAQSSSTPSSFNRKSVESATTNITAFESDEAVLNNLKVTSEKTHRHFTKQFKNAKNIRMYTQNGNTYISCFRKEIFNRACYNSKGKLLHFIRYYSQKGLPYTTNQLVKSEFRGYQITGVIEVNMSGVTAYLVSVETKNEFKRLKVIDGDLSIYEEYKKL